MLETIGSHRVSWSNWYARNEITKQGFTVLESCSISTTDTWKHPSPCSLPKLQLQHKVRRCRPKWFLPPAGCSHSCLRERQWARFSLLNIADIFQCRHRLNTHLQFQLHDLSSVLFGHSQHPAITSLLGSQCDEHSLETVTASLYQFEQWTNTNKITPITYQAKWEP